MRETGEGMGEEAGEGAGEGSGTGVRRERILRAAIAAFAERGFDGATWKAIAEEASVTQGLIRFYFQSKDNLWRAAVQKARDERVAHMPPSAVGEAGGEATRPTRAGVERWLRAFAEHVARFPQEARILAHEARAPTARLRWASEAFLRQDSEDFLQAVRTLQGYGWFRDIDPDALRYMMVGATQYMFLVPGEARLVSDLDTHTDGVVAAHVEAVVRLFMAHAPEE